jgi:type IV pilus assembly protein PilV
MNMMTNHNEQGFTLVEVLISMTIFAFGVLAVINMQMLSASMNFKARGMTEAVIIAQSKVEELSALPYSDAALQDTNGDGLAGFTIIKEDVDAGNADQSDNTDAPYLLFWNVADDEPMANTKKIRVIVRWNVKGVTSNFEIEMMKTNS